MKIPDRTDVLMAMQQHGGSFVKALSMAWLRADPHNQAKLMSAFEEYYEKYKAIALHDINKPIDSPESID